MKYILYRLFEQVGDASIEDEDVEPELIAVEYGSNLAEVADALIYDVEDALNEAYGWVRSVFVPVMGNLFATDLRLLMAKNQYL